MTLGHRRGPATMAGAWPPCDVGLQPMGARHLRGVAAVERATSPRPWPPATFRRELEDPATRRYVVACLAWPRRRPIGKVVGFAGMQARPEATHVTNIAVAPAQQRRGVGGALLAWLLATAAELGHEAVTLEVRAGNAPARRLYARAGFQEVGMRPGYYRQPEEDAVIMWLALAGAARPGGAR
ncbi:MAG: ribosomal-protein-alanine N-acetyltransferase [Actinobacteria bacterium QS_5_72_10]|nr:MAG: ribosomal-protein-alanine N-acetyltransferase [Actinobacteria bacterium QS_5_72_10]